MPTARESLLDAAGTALAGRPWPLVRMIDVAAVAGVSRQTLYNEFGSKDGLARALVRREADAYLAGVDRALKEAGIEAVAEWTVTAAGSSALVRAVLTGCWGERLPAPALAGVPSSSTVPAQRRADGPLPGPGDVVKLVRERAAAALRSAGRPWAEADQLARDCELAVRLALSCLLAPPGDGGVGRLLREALSYRRRDATT
ncbi:TetR family transcriptional regulator [Streptomyces sp. CB01635]|uniref:TetR/AcrR family transcriptional regulator n=1 Tax=Streptomyces sp. CB01635 TaxID=2020326 RepID=UPI000C27386A|nr:TetR/AcrR family transcriptional regulator [Streptomyces sp. CB01635]PJN09002.1 TetR family transcriptional regulator [Streptomyces sp. CB01635]